MSPAHPDRRGVTGPQATRAIVLRTVKYSDRSVVLRAYTERFGLRAYIVRTGGKDTSRQAALQPLSRVELVVPEAGEHRMRTVRDLRIDRPYTRVQQEPRRGVLLLFAQEVLDRTLREEAADPRLFDFVLETLESLDTDPDTAHQPLLMLVGLAKRLGFFPEPPQEGEDRFDLREGYFFRGEAPHEFCMEPASAALFAQLITQVEDRVHEGRLHGSSAAVRRCTMDDLLLYFRLHVEGFGELRSLDVLRTVLD